MNIDKLIAPGIIEGFQGAVIIAWEIIKGYPWLFIGLGLLILISKMKKH